MSVSVLQSRTIPELSAFLQKKIGAFVCKLRGHIQIEAEATLKPQTYKTPLFSQGLKITYNDQILIYLKRNRSLLHLPPDYKDLVNAPYDLQLHKKPLEALALVNLHLYFKLELRLLLLQGFNYYVLLLQQVTCSSSVSLRLVA